jgi:osmotically-inducible protein OsmY
MTDDQLQLDVAAELLWDAKVDGRAIAVSANGGTITLRGIVGSFREKTEAKKAAERVYGVTAVSNELEVHILDDDRREDAEVRGDVLQALTLDSQIPPTIDARVKDGWVALTGTAAWQYQRNEATFVAGNVPGVCGVDDEIRLTIPPDGCDVKNEISTAFARNAELDADGLLVDTGPYGTVTVSGVVHSWAAHDEALAAAWAALGVGEVYDLIKVEY